MSLNGDNISIVIPSPLMMRLSMKEFTHKCEVAPNNLKFQDGEEGKQRINFLLHPLKIKLNCSNQNNKNHKSTIQECARLLPQALVKITNTGPKQQRFTGGCKSGMEILYMHFLGRKKNIPICHLFYFILRPIFHLFYSFITLSFK